MAGNPLLVVIDSNSVIHRAFHALPPLTTKDGRIVSAVYGFLLVFLKVVRELEPSYFAACFDTQKPTFRHQKFKEYKATRPPTPPDIKSQIPLVKKVLSGFGVPVFEKEGFEADDIIGTICESARRQNSKIETAILSGDLDNLQLADSATKVYFLKGGVRDTAWYDEKKVRERYLGLVPAQLVDFRALRGDPSDNIPGVKGVGEKTAIKLLREYGNLEGIYDGIEKKNCVLQDSLKEKLRQGRKAAFLSRELARIKKDVPIEFDLGQCRWGKYDRETVAEIFRKFGFQSLIKKLSDGEKSGSDNNLRLW